MSTQKLLSSFDLQDYMDKHSIPGMVESLDLTTNTVVQAAIALNISPQQIIKSLLFIIDDEPVLLISAGISPINKKIVRNHFGVSRKKLRFAKAEEILEITGYRIGTLPPFGHVTKLKTIIDPSVMESHTVYGGGGDPMTMVKVESIIIMEHTNAELVEISR